MQIKRDYKMKTQVSRWGNSLGVRISKAVAAAANVEDGDEVDVSVEDGAIVIRPAVRRYTIEELIADMTPEDAKDVGWGPPVGKEVW
jgi:antitoxin MazE